MPLGSKRLLGWGVMLRLVSQHWKEVGNGCVSWRAVLLGIAVNSLSSPLGGGGHMRLK